MSEITVSNLTVYPVKSLRGIEVESFKLTKTGPEFDRQWMVVNQQGHFLTQRRLAKMCLINTRIDDNTLIIGQQGLGEVAVPRGGGEAIAATVWQDQVAAQDCGDEVALWLENALGRRCRMVFIPPGAERRVANSNHTIGFADGYPLLLANDQSLVQFNTHLSKPIEMNRFRPNITVSGADAWAEDQWQNINIGQQAFRVVSPCTRCVIPSINPQTGEKQHEVLQALNQFRRFGTQTRFGQNVTYEKYRRVQRGDHVEVLL